MSLNALDTNVLIHSSRPLRDTHPLAHPARELVRSLKAEAKNQRIIVPSVVIAEYLTGIPSEKRTKVLSEMQNWIHIAPFDMKGAAIAADLMQEVLKLRKSGDPEISSVNRQCLKADVEVMATSIAHGAKVLYTTEVEKFAKIVGGKISIKSIEEPPQGWLFSVKN
jgi:predicted nucleic acid-binding protein